MIDKGFKIVVKSRVLEYAKIFPRYFYVCECIHYIFLQLILIISTTHLNNSTINFINISITILLNEILTFNIYDKKKK